MSYKLWYFPFRGRGEQVRLLLHALGQTFENVAVTRERFAELKREGPRALTFGSVPVLDDGDFRLAQGPVIMGYLARKHGMAPTDLKLAAQADAIVLGAEDLRTQYFRLFGEDAEARRKEFLEGNWRTRWLPAFEALLERIGDTGFFVGNTLTHADVAVWDALDAVLTYIDGVSLEGYPRLHSFRDALRQRSALTPYLSQRPAK